MAVVNPVIIQITGFQNSGKTSFVKRLLRDLGNEDISAVTMKHHGHGGKPSLPEDKDSAQHIAAGAIASLVEGDGRLIIQAEKKEWSLEAKLRLLLPFQSDVILIEGHKYEDYPKVILVRRREEAAELLSLKNIIAVYFWENVSIEEVQWSGIPAFHIDCHEGYQWLVQYLRTAIKKKSL